MPSRCLMLQLVTTILLAAWISPSQAFVEINSIKPEPNLINPEYDVVVYINDVDTAVPKGAESIQSAINEYKALNPTLSSGTVVPFLSHPSKKLIVGFTGSLQKDYADSRLIYSAAKSAAKTIKSLGLRKPLFVIGGFASKLPNQQQKWAEGNFPTISAILGALHELYVPLQVRESRPGKYPRYDSLGIFKAPTNIVDVIKGIEHGRYVTRDLCASDQVRMAPTEVEKYIKQNLEAAAITSSGPIDPKEYPMLDAVNRAVRGDKLYDGRVIKLEYTPANKVVTDTLYFIGKGVTYDTGGISLKTKGGMRWMRKDMCGASAIAGFIKSLHVLKPPGLKVLGRLGFVYNAIGDDAYAVDEIIKSRAGVRSRIGSTDAEGRNVMVDLLAEAKEEAAVPGVVNPHLFTIATLTGSVGSSFGHIPAVLDNGPGRKAKMAQALRDGGALVADPGQVATLRREDYENSYPITQYEDLQQRNTHPETVTYRGFQYPAAWMLMASKTTDYGLGTAKEIPYTHLDVSSAVGVKRSDGTATGTPTSMLIATYVFPKLNIA